METSFEIDVKDGLSKNQKSLSSKYLYDNRGSELFVEITKLDEYYLTDCELEIFNQQSKNIIEAIPENISEVVEFGCGDGHKTVVLLKNLTNINNTKFVPVDISKTAIDSISDTMKKEIPELDVEGYHGDYFDFLKQEKSGTTGSRLFLFLGSNIGNFSPDEAVQFLGKISSLLGPKDYLLIGMDLKKKIETLQNAYDDSKGVTSEFNYNLLDRMNRELGASFERGSFTHHAYFDPAKGAMESYLVSKKEQMVRFEDINFEVSFDNQEAIHVESSYKYSFRDIDELAKQAGFERIDNFTDSRSYFVDSLWKVR